MLPDPKLSFELVCDASGVGLGAVLLQQGRPISYWSRKTLPAEQNYVVPEQELLAVIEALECSGAILVLTLRLLLITKLTLSWTLKRHCPEGKLVGVKNCNVTISTGCTDRPSKTWPTRYVVALSTSDLLQHLL